MFDSKPNPVVVVGGASPGREPSAPGGALSAAPRDACDLAGVYVVPARVALHGTITTADVAKLVSQAGYADEAEGSYLLQASSGQTVVLTSIHTVLIKRVPANSVPSTVVVVNPMCVGAPEYEYLASIDLDGANLTPKLSLVDRATGTAKTITHPTSVVTQDTPLMINFKGVTAKNDVSWKLRFDYVVKGKAETSVVPASGGPFQRNTTAPGDPELTLTMKPRGSTWASSMKSTSSIAP